MLQLYYSRSTGTQVTLPVLEYSSTLLQGTTVLLIFWDVLKLATQGTRCARAWGPRPSKTRLSTVEWPVAVLRRVFGRFCPFGRVLRVP